MKSGLSVITLGILTLPLNSCGTLPASGPYSKDVKSDAAIYYKTSEDLLSFAGAGQAYNFTLVDVTKLLTDYLGDQHKTYEGLTDWPDNSRGESVRIAVGDEIQVTIYESQSGGLFIPSEAGVRPGNFVTIPSQLVDRTGVINIPFAGEINVVGRSANNLAKEITEKLGERAIEPQAVVSITSRGSSEVSVIGEVENASRFPISLNGDKVLDAIARAGGPSFPGYETYVTLQRRGNQYTAPFDLLVTQPEMNIGLQADDTLYVYREPEQFQMFGASVRNGTFNFTRRKMTLAEALGETGGLNDGQADPSEVYLYRFEKRRTMDDLALSGDVPGTAAYEEKVPVIYRLDLRAADGYFLAQKFPVYDDDVIYVANAESVELAKFLDILGLSATTKFDTQESVQQ